jgi:hypothetical protein
VISDVLCHCYLEGRAATVAETGPFVTQALLPSFSLDRLYTSCHQCPNYSLENPFCNKEANPFVAARHKFSGNPKTKKCCDRLRLHGNLKSITENSRNIKYINTCPGLMTSITDKELCRFSSREQPSTRKSVNFHTQYYISR